MGTRLDNETDLAGQLGPVQAHHAPGDRVPRGPRAAGAQSAAIGTQVVARQGHPRGGADQPLRRPWPRPARDPSTTVVSFPHRAGARTRWRPSSASRPGRRCTSSSGCATPAPSPLALMRNHVPEHLLHLTAGGTWRRRAFTNLFRANGHRHADRQAGHRSAGRDPRPRPRALGGAQGGRRCWSWSVRPMTSRDGRWSTATTSTGPSRYSFDLTLDRMVTQVTRVRRALVV